MKLEKCVFDQVASELKRGLIASASGLTQLAEDAKIALVENGRTVRVFQSADEFVNALFDAEAQVDPAQFQIPEVNIKKATEPK